MPWPSSPPGKWSTPPPATARKRFISDYYGLKALSELDAEDGSTPSDITPREMFDAKFKDYGLDKLTDENGDPVTLTDEEALGIMNIPVVPWVLRPTKY